MLSFIKKLICLFAILFSFTIYAESKTIIFENYPLGTTITSQYTGVLFSAEYSYGGAAPPPIIHAPSWGTTSPNKCLQTRGDVQNFSYDFLIMTFSKLQKNVWFDLGFKVENPNQILIYTITAYDTSGILINTQTINLFTGTEPDKVIFPVHVFANNHIIKTIHVEGKFLSGSAGPFELIDNLRYESKTPLAAQILEPTNLSCICDSVDIIGTAYDTDQLFDYYSVEVAKIPADGSTPEETDFNLLNIGYTPITTPDILAQWDTAGYQEGWYVIRLTVFNSFGESVTAQQQVFVDKSFELLAFTSPLDDAVVGRNVCLYGTIYDYCIDNYIIEYKNVIGGPWHTITTGTSNIINNILAVWDTSSISGGKYNVKITAYDVCGHVAVNTKQIYIDNIAPTAVITSPTNCTRVDGIVPIYGTAYDSHMNKWVLQYTGGSTHDWVDIASGDTNINNDLLAKWDTTSLEPCAYTVRLVVYDDAVLDCVSIIHNRTEYSVSLVKTINGDLTLDGCVDDFDLIEVIGSFGEGCDN